LKSAAPASRPPSGALGQSVRLQLEHKSRIGR
jgi:hypothetical protein